MKNKFKFISCLIIFLAIIIFTNISYCADGVLSASQTIAGDKITVNITSNKALGAFTLKASGLSAISGESDVGEYGGNSIAGVSMKGTKNLGKFVFSVPEKDTKVTFSVSGVADAENNDLSIDSTTITLKGKKIEETTIDKKEDTTTNKDTTTTDKNTSNTDKGSTTTNKDTTKTPEKPKEKSNNAYLSTLGVTPKEYDFTGFKKGTTNYSVTVPSDVDSLKVLYKTVDSNATVKVKGNSGFEVGSENKITIKVTAEDGKTTKTYTIKVTKLAEEEEKPGNVIEDEEGIYLTSLELEGVDISPKFKKDTYSYIATLDDADVTEIKVNAKANKENANVEISGNTGLVAGENTINILVTLDGREEQTVYQIILNKAEKEVAGAIDTEKNNLENSETLTDLMGELKKYVLIGVAIIIFIILAIIVLIILLRRENRKENDEETEVEEYNVYKNDENEFENKKSEADNFIESLYRQRNGNLYNEEELDVEVKQTIEEINRETDKIFADKVEGQSIEYTSEEFEEVRRPRRRSKGKHSK